MRSVVLMLLLSTSTLSACGSSHTTDGGVDASSPDSSLTDAGMDAIADSAMDAPLPACPADPRSAEGTACPLDGQACGDCPGDPCGFCNQLLCMSGTWVNIEAFPAPCHECGDAGPCVSISEYCDIGRSDVGGVPDSYQCIALPDACLGDLSCGCLQMNGVVGESCTGEGTTGLTVEHFGG